MFLDLVRSGLVGMDLRVGRRLSNLIFYQKDCLMLRLLLRRMAQGFVLLLIFFLAYHQCPLGRTYVFVCLCLVFRLV